MLKIHHYQVTQRILKICYLNVKYKNPFHGTFLDLSLFTSPYPFDVTFLDLQIYYKIASEGILLD